MAGQRRRVRRRISIHALREEGDGSDRAAGGRNCQFLSTPSARRATISRSGNELHPTQFLSTPSARRATVISYDLTYTDDISIHALREEGDYSASRAALMEA